MYISDEILQKYLKIHKFWNICVNFQEKWTMQYKMFEQIPQSVEFGERKCLNFRDRQGPNANFREIWRRTLCLGLILLLLYSFEISATNGRLKSTTILHNDISHLRHETLSMFIIRKNYVELTQAENRVRWSELLHQHTSTLVSFRGWSVASTRSRIPAWPQNRSRPKLVLYTCSQTRKWRVGDNRA